MNLWGEGPVLVGDEEKLSVPEKFTDPTGANNLNFEILFEVSAAKEAVKKYFKLDAKSI